MVTGDDRYTPSFCFLYVLFASLLGAIIWGTWKADIVFDTNVDCGS